MEGWIKGGRDRLKDGQRDKWKGVQIKCETSVWVNGRMDGGKEK